MIIISFLVCRSILPFLAYINVTLLLSFAPGSLMNYGYKLEGLLTSNFSDTYFNKRIV